MFNSKLLRLIALSLILSLALVSYADAYVWWLIAGAVRVGTIAVSALVSSELFWPAVRVAVDYAVLGGLAYMYFDRGASTEPSSERYVQVDLVNTKAAATTLKDSGSILTAVPPGGWSTSNQNTVVTDGCSVDSGPFPCQAYKVSDSGGTGIAQYGGQTPCGGDTYALRAKYRLYTAYGQWTGEQCSLIIANTSQKAAYQASEVSRVAAVATIQASPSLTATVQDAVGKDMQAGGTFVGTPTSGMPVEVVGQGGRTKEFGTGYTDGQVNDWLALSAQYNSGTSTTSNVTDVSGVVSGLSSVNTSVGLVKTSVDGVKTSVDAAKTSVDAVKTSVDAAKTSVDAAKTSVDGVKTSVDAINTKIPAGSYTGGNGSGHSAYVPPESNSISATWSNFKTDMEGTQLFGLSGSFFDAVPTSVEPTQIDIDGGDTFGTAHFNFDFYAPGFLILKGIILVCCSYIAVRVVILKH
jgi:hypothetical protein